MSATDDPLTNLHKAMKKLVPVQRNLNQAGCGHLTAEVVRVKEMIARQIEALEATTGPA